MLFLKNTFLTLRQKCDTAFLLINLLFIFIYSNDLTAQGRIPIQNFDAEDMRVNSPVVYSIIQDSGGVLYFANSAGVLAYDGAYWTIFPTPTPVRSLAIDQKGKIYVGCVSDFGSLEPETNGSVVFQSYKKLLDKKVVEYGWISEIIIQPSGVYFYSDEVIFQLTKPTEGTKKLVALKSTGTFSGIINLNSQLLVYNSPKDIGSSSDEGFYFIQNNKMTKANLLPLEYGIYKDVPLTNGDRIIISDEFKAQLLKTGNPLQIEELRLPIKNVVAAVGLKDGKIAAVSDDGEIIIVSINGEIEYQIDSASELKTTYFFSLFEDQQGGIWASHSKGLTRISRNNPVRDWTKLSSQMGSIRALHEYKGNLYLGGLNGIYLIAHNSNNLINVAGISEEVNQFCTINTPSGERLLACTSPGLYDISDGDKTIIELPEEVTNVYQAKTYELNTLYVAHEKGVSGFKWENNKWILTSNTSSNTPTCNSITFSSSGDLWAGTLTNGALKFPKGNLSSYELFDADKGLADGRIIVMNLDNEIIFYSQTRGYFRLEKNKFIPIPSLNQYKNENYYLEPRLSPDGTLWILGNKNVRSLKYTKGGNTQPIESSYAYFSQHKATAALKTDKETWNASYERLWYAPATEVSQSFINFKPLIRNIYIRGDKLFHSGFFTDLDIEPESRIGGHFDGHICKFAEDGTIYSVEQSKDSDQKLSYNFNEIRFEVSATSYEGKDANQFQYILEGLEDEWSEWTKQTSHTYSNLSEGKYVLKVRAQNAFGQISPTVSEYKFTILPPFYRHWSAYLIYALLLVGTFFAAVKLNSKRLEEKNLKLEAIVNERTEEINKQKKIIEEKNESITDSIIYAKRIQELILPGRNLFENAFKNYFIFYSPRDIVSGDFYWCEHLKNSYENRIYIAAVDCTGHGVPGALMSIVGFHQLTEAFKSIIASGTFAPGDILHEMDKRVRFFLKQDQPDSQVKDGMDASLVCIDFKNNELLFSGAFRPLILIRDGKNMEFKGSKFPIGGDQFENKIYTTDSITLKKGDIFYLFTDGFTDQFGGEKVGNRIKKFTSHKFYTLLEDIHHLSFSEQKNIVESSFLAWKGKENQIDDVLVMGFKYER